MSELPRKPDEALRQQVISALRDSGRRFLDHNGSSRGYLDKWGLSAEGLYEDLANALDSSDRLFQKPKTFPNQNQRYQCVLTYPEDLPEYPEIETHVTIAPSGKDREIRVKISVHPSNTAQTLPTIPTQ